MIIEKKNIFGRPLIKDPMAILSTEWLYERFNAKIVVVMRHPAGFIGSLKKAGWTIPFSGLLSQKEKLNSHLGDFIPIIENYTRQPPGIIDQGIIIWNIVYTMIRYYREKFDGQWYFVKHETLSKDPVGEFHKLFTFLDIPWTREMNKIVTKSSDGSVLNRLSRNSAENVGTWKTRLSTDEICRIKDGTKRLYSYFYDENDWS